MSAEQIIMLIFIVLGVVVALVGLYRKSREYNSMPVAWREKAAGVDGYDAVLRKMEEHMVEIDKTLEEFHSTANAAIMELDEKYQELLFLYSLIDEKKKEVADIYSMPAAAVQPAAAPQPAKSQTPKPNKARAAETQATRSSHPRRKEILNLHKQGLSVTEIAEELNIGQDMVRLILEMGKAR